MTKGPFRHPDCRCASSALAKPLADSELPNVKVTIVDELTTADLLEDCWKRILAAMESNNCKLALDITEEMSWILVRQMTDAPATRYFSQLGHTEQLMRLAGEITNPEPHPCECDCDRCKLYLSLRP